MAYLENGPLPTPELEEIREACGVVIHNVKNALFESGNATFLGEENFPAISLLKTVRDTQYEKMTELPVLMVLSPGVMQDEINGIRLVRELSFLDETGPEDALQIEKQGRVELTMGISGEEEGTWILNFAERQINISKLRQLKPNEVIKYLGILLRKEEVRNNLLPTEERMKIYAFPVSLPRSALKAFCGEKGWLISPAEFRQKIREAKK